MFLYGRTDVLKGYVTLDGPRISKAEIHLHLPTWNKGHPVPVHLENPVVLPQISNCSTFIELSMQSLLSAKHEKSAFLILESLVDAIRYCRQALDSLENSNNTCPMVRAIFSGAPDDLAVSFGIQNARIVAAAYVSTPISASTLSGTSMRGSSKSSLVGHPLTNMHEVLVRVDSVVPALTAAHEMLVYCIYNLSNLHSQIRKLVNIA